MKKFLVSAMLFNLAAAGFSFSGQDPRDSDSPFGALAFLSWDHEWNKHHFDGDKAEKAADLMKEAGVAFVRMDFFWADIEPVKGKFDFKKYDRLVEMLSKRNIKVLAILQYNAPWESAVWNSPPDPERYTDYARRVVDHFKDKIKYWEIWNEPDCKIYWSPQDDMKSYARLLKSVYPALKEMDPTCVVVLGGLSQNISIQLKHIYKLGGGNFFDVVNIHPFVNPLLPNAMALLKGEYLGVYKVMEANRDTDKPIWFTELGCPGTDAPDRKGWWAGKSPTEAEQAEWVEKIYGEPLRWKGVKKIFWAFFRDTRDHFGNGVDHFGLVREDFSRKPAFESYKKTTKAYLTTASLD